MSLLKYVFPSLDRIRKNNENPNPTHGWVVVVLAVIFILLTAIMQDKLLDSIGQ